MTSFEELFGRSGADAVASLGAFGAAFFALPLAMPLGKGEPASNRESD